MKLFGAYLPIFLAIGLAIVLLECEAGRRGGGGKKKNHFDLTCLCDQNSFGQSKMVLV